MSERFDELMDNILESFEKAIPHTDKLIDAAILYSLWEVGSKIGNPLLGVISYQLATTPISGEVSTIKIAWGGLEIPASPQFVGILGLSTLGVVAGISGLLDKVEDKIPTDDDIDTIIEESTDEEGTINWINVIDRTSDLANYGISPATQGLALDLIVQATVDAQVAIDPIVAGQDYRNAVKLALLPIYAAEKIRRGEPLG